MFQHISMQFYSCILYSKSTQLKISCFTFIELYAEYAMNNGMHSFFASYQIELSRTSTINTLFYRPKYTKRALAGVNIYILFLV